MAMSRIHQYELQLKHEITQERVESLLRESPPALQEKVNWIRNYFQDEWRRSIVGRYQVAAAIREIYDDVTDNGGAVYGTRAVEVIKKAFGWDDGLIYRALNVADAFTSEKIEDIAQLRLPGGKPLSYSHVVVLSQVEDDRHREKILKQTVREGWTTRRLTNAVDLVVTPEPGKAPERRGRPLAKPRDFDAVLDQQASFAEDFLNRNDQVWADVEHSLSAKVKDMDTADYTQERADSLKRHAKVMELLAQKAKERAEETMQVHKLFVKVLKELAAKDKKLGSQATPGKADDPA